MAIKLAKAKKSELIEKFALWLWVKRILFHVLGQYNECKLTTNLEPF